MRRCTTFAVCAPLYCCCWPDNAHSSMEPHLSTSLSVSACYPSFSDRIIFGLFAPHPLQPLAINQLTKLFRFCQNSLIRITAAFSLLLPADKFLDHGHSLYSNCNSFISLPCNNFCCFLNARRKRKMLIKTKICGSLTSLSFSSVNNYVSFP